MIGCAGVPDIVAAAGHASGVSMHGAAAFQGSGQHQVLTASAIEHADGKGSELQHTPVELKAVDRLTRLLPSGSPLPIRSRKVPPHTDVARHKAGLAARQLVVPRLTDNDPLKNVSSLSFTEYWCAF
jgi:hypothetical protein